MIHFYAPFEIWNFYRNLFVCVLSLAAAANTQDTHVKIIQI